MKIRWSALGGQLGLGFVVVGFVFVFLGWNGAASYDRVPAQVPYLVSGGVAGLCFVILGVGLVIVQNQRTDRAALSQQLAQLGEALDRLATSSAAARNGGSGNTGAEAGGLVAIGPTTYHLPTCHLLEGRTGAPLATPDDARARGLEPCRVCSPDEAPAEPVPARRRRTRA
jgi:uncharacterized membrane protein